MEKLHQRIKIAREYAGLTQAELGAKFDPKITKSAVSQWESEVKKYRTKPTLGRLFQIATFTGVNPGWLIYDPKEGENRFLMTSKDYDPQLSDEQLRLLAEATAETTFRGTLSSGRETLNSAARLLNVDPDILAAALAEARLDNDNEDPSFEQISKAILHRLNPK